MSREMHFLMDFYQVRVISGAYLDIGMYVYAYLDVANRNLPVPTAYYENQSLSRIIYIYPCTF